ncbi:hypothetical protein BDN67DRAFT_870211, partial [Paxillus ammoniavirescens]
DLFSYFKDLAAQKKLPSIDMLESATVRLHSTYSSTHTIHNALRDTCERDLDWTNNIPEGSQWVEKEMSRSRAEDTSVVKTPFHGDLILAKLIAFMWDALLSCEAAYAVADGDTGRVYETMKVLMPFFA